MARPERDEYEYVSVREFMTEMTKVKVMLALNSAAVVWAVTGHPAPGAIAGAITAAIGIFR